MSTEGILIIIGLLVSISGMIILSRYGRVHAFISLLIASILYGLINRQPIEEIIQSMQTGFGSLLAQIGILVVLGSLLGVLLEKSGAMEVISTSLLKIFGPRHAVLGVTVIGAVVGIPVFCDSGFIILSRLVPAMAAKASVNPASLSLGLSSGLYTTHTIVPPTPGPLAAAANLGATDFIGLLMLWGIVVTVPVVIVSFLLAKRFGVRITSTSSDEVIHPPATYASWKAFLPLVLPIVLIALSSLLRLMEYSNGMISFFQTLGIPVVALSLGIVTALPLVERRKRSDMPVWISEAIKDAGVILLITGAGGSFGAVIKSSHIDILLQQYLGSSLTNSILFLVLAFVLAAVLKTSQGSSTSSIIITSSLLAPLAASAGLQSPTEISFLIIAIGGGSMVVSHVNDSYFWVVSQFGNIRSDDALKSFTVISFFQGLMVLLTCILLLILNLSFS